MHKLSKILLSHSLIGLLLLATALIYHRTDHVWIEYLRHHTFDLYQQIQPRQPEPEKMAAPVKIIDIDEASLREFGQWPWSRLLLANLVEKLTQFGVSVIGFDMVFSEPDRASPTLVLNERADIPSAVKSALADMESNDAILAKALSKSPNVLGQVGIYKETPGMPLTRKVGYGALSADADTLIYPLLNQYRGVVHNLPELEENATGIGLFSTSPGYGGTIRKVALIERVGDVTYPSLSLEMLRVALGGKDDYLLKGSKDGMPGIESIVVKTANPKMRFEIPTEADSSVWVHFARYPSGERPLYISARDVLKAESPEAQKAMQQTLGGALVILGTSAVGLKDIRKTPVNSVLPGVEVHAQLLETILSDSHLTRPFEAIMIEWSLILVGGLLMIFLVPRLSAFWTFTLSALLIGSLIAIAWHYYTASRQLVDASYPSLAIFSMFVVLSYLNYMREERERRQIKNAFSHYVSPDLLKELAENPEKLALGGETRNITVLFSDIRGFTTISERFNAQELTRFINKFLTPMTNVILNHKGTIDKYMGDAIMAFWNAPMEVTNHPYHACIAALKMQIAVKELNEKLLKEAMESQDEGQNRRRYVPISIGVGLNTDDCCVGNMGSDQRFDYSALGDGVNLASRLEGQSKTYGVDIVLGRNTVDALFDELAVIELDIIQVKGKTEPVTIYALLGDEAMRASDAFNELRRQIDHMLGNYRKQKWDNAQKIADTMLQDTAYTAVHGLCRLYLERIRDYRETPPPANWDGVYIATSK